MRAARSRSAFAGSSTRRAIPAEGIATVSTPDSTPTTVADSNRIWVVRRCRWTAVSTSGQTRRTSVTPMVDAAVGEP